MLDRTRNRVRSTRNHVVNHRAKYSAIATATVVSLAWHAQQKDMITFLMDRGLWEEFVAANPIN